MKKFAAAKILFLGTALVLSGCTIRTYPLTRDRVNQSLIVGNRGYLQGKPPEINETEIKKTRTVQIVEVELGSPLKFEKAKNIAPQETTAQPQAESVTEGNRGYVNQSETLPAGNFEKYVVQKNDTLQKISMKFFNTTKKWTKIYDANKDTMKTPNKLYPGKTINIPVEAKETLKEPKENLK